MEWTDEQKEQLEQADAAGKHDGRHGQYPTTFTASERKEMDKFDREYWRVYNKALKEIQEDLKLRYGKDEIRKLRELLKEQADE